MRKEWIAVLSLLGMVVVVGPWHVAVAHAEGFSLERLSPFSPSGPSPRVEESAPAASATATDQGPSLWEQIQQDMRRLNANTRRFFSDTAEALTPRWPRRPTPPTTGWLGPRRKPGREEERSWFGGLFAPEEPRMPQSPQDFVGMDRPEM